LCGTQYYGYDSTEPYDAVRKNMHRTSVGRIGGEILVYYRKNILDAVHRYALKDRRYGGRGDGADGDRAEGAILPERVVGGNESL
jgi:hypothetical protein